MNRKYFTLLIGIAAACLLLIIFTVIRSDRTTLPDDTPELPTIHTKAPFKTYISAIGIVEPSTNNIYVGAPMNRILQKIFVKVGSHIEVGTPLFRMENADLKAELIAQQATYRSALLNLEKLKSLPRPEDLAAAKATFETASIELEQAKKNDEMVQGLADSRALSLEEINRRHFAYKQAQAKWQQAKADFDKIQEGTWKFDLDSAKLAVLQAKANVERVATELERTTVRSPIDGSVLQIKIQEGEMPSMDTLRNPIMIIGNIDQLHVRVSINQFDLPFFRTASPAVAYVQGHGNQKYDLEFVHIEPMLTDKQNINNDVMEKVDTYVLQVIYRVKHESNRDPLYVGQKMDVYIEAKYNGESKQK